MGQSDKERFDGIVEALRKRLRIYLERPSNARPKPSGADGWYCTIGTWASKRPKIVVWFDHWFDEDPVRHFWFGFEGTAESLRPLIDSLPLRFPRPLLWQIDHFTQQSGNAGLSDIELVKRHAGPVHEIYDGPQQYLGMYDVGLKGTAGLVEEGSDFILSIIESVDPHIMEKAEIEDLKTRKTEREALFLARIGQGRFRKALEEHWGGCAVPNSLVREVLRASHIKPWRNCSDEERLDPQNGLLLSATLDALFDRRLISFDDIGELLVASTLSREEWERLGLKPEMRLARPPTREQREYLRAHRNGSDFNKASLIGSNPS